jgi:hypothetical protein
MNGLNGKAIQPTYKIFYLEFCTIATWNKGKIVEERLFYDSVGMITQIGALSS